MIAPVRHPGLGPRGPWDSNPIARIVDKPILPARTNRSFGVVRPRGRETREASRSGETPRVLHPMASFAYDKLLSPARVAGCSIVVARSWDARRKVLYPTELRAHMGPAGLEPATSSGTG